MVVKSHEKKDKINLAKRVRIRHTHPMTKTNETKFTKENLIKDGMYLLFGTERKFVARFKPWHSRVITMAKFRKELIANHTPAEYFKAHDNGKAPLDILKEANPAWYNNLVAPFRFSI